MTDALRANPLSRSMPAFGQASADIDISKLRNLASAWKEEEIELEERKARSSGSAQVSKGASPASRHAGVCLVVACSLTHAADRMDLPDPLIEL